MAARTGTVLFSAPTPAGVTARIATVTVTTAGVAAPPVLLDYTTAVPTFACNDGDVLSATATDTDATGTSVVSNTITQTVGAPGVIGAPVLTGFLIV